MQNNYVCLVLYNLQKALKCVIAPEPQLAHNLPECSVGQEWAHPAMDRWEPGAEECDIAATVLVEIWPLWILTLRYVAPIVRPLLTCHSYKIPTRVSKWRDPWDTKFPVLKLEKS